METKIKELEDRIAALEAALKETGRKL